jgi:hypothetical protein
VHPTPSVAVKKEHVRVHALGVEEARWQTQNDGELGEAGEERLYSERGRCEDDQETCGRRADVLPRLRSAPRDERKRPGGRRLTFIVKT